MTSHRESTSGFERGKTNDGDSSYIKDLRDRLRKELTGLFVVASNHKALGEDESDPPIDDEGVAEGGDEGRVGDGSQTHPGVHMRLRMRLARRGDSSPASLRC